MGLFNKILTGLGVVGAASGAVAEGNTHEMSQMEKEPTANTIQQEQGTSSEDVLNDLMKAENVTLSPKKAEVVMPGEEQSLEQLEAENNRINESNRLHNEAARAAMAEKTGYEIADAREAIQKIQEEEKGSVSEDPTTFASK